MSTLRRLLLGYRKPNCVWFPFKIPIPKNCPAPIASLDCIILYPAPLGSKSGFKYISILVFACSGKTYKYKIGTSITTNIKEVIIYLFFIPPAKSINIAAARNATAVPIVRLFYN